MLILVALPLLRSSLTCQTYWGRGANGINEPHYSLIKTHSLEQPHAIFVRREQFQRAPRTA
jgi:hypothetical protein